MEAHRIVTETAEPNLRKNISNVLLFIGAVVIFLVALFTLPSMTAPAGGAGALAAALPPVEIETSGSVVEIGSDYLYQGMTATVGITATVPATASLDAFTIHIEYDPTILGYVDCNLDGTFTGLCNNSDDDGSPPDVVSFSAVNVSGVNGVLSLGDITFSADGLGGSLLHIVVATWSDGSGITPVTVDGQISVVPEPSPTPTVTSTSPPNPTPTITLTPSATPCPTHFEGDLIHGSNFTNVTGDVGGDLIIYDQGLPGTPPTGTPPVIGTAVLAGPFDNHDCLGFIVAPVVPPLQANHRIQVVNLTDGSFDIQTVVPGSLTPTPTSSTPTVTPTSTVPTSTPTVTATSTATATNTPTATVPPVEDYDIYLPAVLK